MYGHFKRFILRVKVFSITMDSPSIGIRADDVGRSRIILREGNYRVWPTILEQTLREKKLWNHVMGTSVPPLTPRVRAPGIAAVGADPILMIAAMAGKVKITQEEVDADDRKLEDYAASIARANSVILHHMEHKDMMSLWGLDSPSQKWNKLRADYALISVQMGTEARAHFFSFKMGNVESVIKIQHRFGAVYSEMAIQGMPEPDEVRARVLMTYPSERWRQYVDNIAIRSPAQKVAEIF